MNCYYLTTLFCMLSTAGVMAMEHITEGKQEVGKIEQKQTIIVEFANKDTMTKVPLDCLQQCKTFKKMVKDYGGAIPKLFDVFNINKRTFEEMLPLLEILTQHATDENKKAVLTKKFASYPLHNKVDEPDLISLLNVADFLELPMLLEVGATVCAQKINKKILKISASTSESRVQELVDLFELLNPLVQAEVAKYIEKPLHFFGNHNVLVQILNGHTQGVKSVCFSPDGTQLVSGSSDKTVKLWDVTTGDCAATLAGHTDWIHSVCFSPDGRQLASASDDEKVKVWNVTTGACTATLAGHLRWIHSVCFSPDGRQLASGSLDGYIKLWNVETKTCTATLTDHAGQVSSVCFSPDGRQLASGSLDGTIKLWNVKTETCTATLTGHTGGIHSVCFSPDGRQLASGLLDGTIKLWNIGTRDCTATLTGHKGRINSLCFSPNGNRIASASDDKSVKLWEVATGDCTGTLTGHTGRMNSACFSPDGRQLASGSCDGAVRLWGVGAIFDAFKAQTLSQVLPLYAIKQRYSTAANI